MKASLSNKDVKEMIADPIFSSFVSDSVAETLRSVGDEFTEAERQNNVSERLGRKYHEALRAYENALGDCSLFTCGNDD